MRKTKGRPVRRAKMAKKRVSVRKPGGLTLRVPGLSRQAWELNDEQVTLIKNTVAKGATDDELQLFLTTARRHRLDPFTHQIWFVRRWDKNADSGKRDANNNAILGAYVGITQIGIDGMTHVAARDHRDFGSISLPQYGPLSEITVGKEKVKFPQWARITVYKKGMAQPTEAEVWWEEYAPSDLSKAPFWRKMPRRMLAKCATALALRQAYPDLSGVYIPEETAKMSEDYTPSGRQIITPDVPQLPTPLSKEQQEWWDKEQAAIAELSKAKSMPDTDAVPCLFYVAQPSGLYELQGQEALLQQHKESLLDFLDKPASRAAKSRLMQPEQVGKLISWCEQQAPPVLIRALDA